MRLDATPRACMLCGLGLLLTGCSGLLDFGSYTFEGDAAWPDAGRALDARAGDAASSPDAAPPADGGATGADAAGSPRDAAPSDSGGSPPDAAPATDAGPRDASRPDTGLDAGPGPACSSASDCPNVSGLPCTSAECRGGRCLPTVLAGSCLIDGACVPQGNRQTMAGCWVCDQDRDRFAWSPVPAGLPCDDGRYCTVGEACDGLGTCGAGMPLSCVQLERYCSTEVCSDEAAGCVSMRAADDEGCLIGGQCYTAGNRQPGEPCMGCYPTRSFTDWVRSPAGVACDDGNPCTINTTCDGSGECGGGGTSC